MHSAIYLGQVRHRRFAPRDHTFDYRLYMMYLDLAELPQVFRGRWFWSTRGPALARFDRRDYLGDPLVPLDQAVRDRVEKETGARPTGPIRLLTHLRYFGHNFNPVSFYYCFDQRDTRVDTIVAEITNTPWGERHAYVLTESMNSGRAQAKRYRLDKRFHVSPFMPMAMRYDWRFSHPGTQLNVHMENLQDGKKMFDATLTLDRKPLSAGAMAHALLAFPLVTIKVVAAIYWQALRLWLKRTPIYSHPEKLPTHPAGGADTAEPR
jgi:DUF1365 family protein